MINSDFQLCRLHHDARRIYTPIQQLYSSDKVFQYNFIGKDLKTNFLTTSKLISIEEQVKLVFKVSTTCGDDFTITKDQQFLTPDGWKCLNDFYPDLHKDSLIKDADIEFTMKRYKKNLKPLIKTIEADSYEFCYKIEREDDWVAIWANGLYIK